MSLRHLPSTSELRCHFHPTTRAIAVASGPVPHRKHVCTVYALLCPSCHAEVNRASEAS